MSAQRGRRRYAPVHRAESVAVTIYLSGNMDEVVSFLEDNGGDPRNVGEDYIEAYVPVSLLGPVSEQPGVIRVREIIPPQPDFGPITSQGVQAHLSAAWNQAGYSGRGVKVGIIDDFRGFSGLMGTELPSTVVARCYTDIGVFTSNLADCEAVGQVSTPFPECQDAVQRRAVSNAEHGTIVAESVIDIAPEVSLYIANPQSRGDLQDAVDWMEFQGVSVINQSLSWWLDGPGDGTSPHSDSPLKTVDRAVARDVIWVNSAGNAAQDTWFGGYSDLDGNGFIEFDGGNDEVLGIPERACRSIRVQLRWEDNWDGAGTDLNLYLYDTRTRQYIRSISSKDEQSGESGHEPFETFRFWSRIDGDDLGIVVDHHGGDAPDWIQIMVWGVGSIERYTESGSIGNPAESANPGMLAVGAAPWYDVNRIESYSSRGPTPDCWVKPDSRVKPDIVGADCGETALRESFCGTSQAAPHVAGLAALVRQRFPGYTPAQVTAYLKYHAQQRVTPDPNNTWGHGFAQLPSPDREALEALYNATGGANWTNNTNWLTNVPVGQWYGVTTDGSGRVTRLDLADNQLTGSIPDELGSLANLEVLNLNDNQLTGEIPTSLGSLANLQELHITRNQFTGTIPAELGSLTNLTILALGGNQLTGPVPTWLGGLTNLEEVYLWGNELTGQIPAELGSLANLTLLSLSQNQLTGGIPVELGSLTKLELLVLNENELTGEIPAGLGSLANLEELYLWENELTGAIPAELGSLANLTLLSLSQNQLTGTIPTELGSLANLEELYLWENELTGVIPVELGSLANLTSLSLSRNQLTGGIPVELGSLANLKELWLADNQLTGEIPVELGNLSNLAELVLWGNRLTGKIPSELGSLSNMELLSISANQLTGEIPAELGNLANLDRLFASGNRLTGEIPPELGGLTNLAELVLWGNRLTGKIPTELGSLAKLKELHLTRNQLTGIIPAELGSLTSLEILALGGNELTGTIPTWLGSLADLEGLYLWGNQLTGEIPSQLGNLTNLTDLALSDNQLTGEIPPELGSLTNLERLRLSNNQLSGEIPAELGRLTNLTVLRLSGNQLTGCVPASLRDVADNDFAELELPFCRPGDPLIARYDANGNGMIDISEVIKAINDYLSGEGDPITIAEVIKLINLYLSGPPAAQQSEASEELDGGGQRADADRPVVESADQPRRSDHHGLPD